MLNKQVVSVPFMKGLDTKSDDKLVVPGHLTLAENAIFTKQGQVKKRNGYDALLKDIDGGGSYVYPKGIADFGNELLTFANDRVYSYSQNNQEWIDKGFCQNVVMDVEQFGVNKLQSYGQSVAIGGTIQCMVYSGAYYDQALNADKIRYFITVKDVSTDAFYVQDLDISGNFNFPATSGIEARVEYENGLFLIFYNENGSLYLKTISESNPSVISAPYLVNNTFKSDLRTKKLGTNTVVCFTNSANSIKLFKFDANAVLQGSATYTNGVIDASTCLVKNNEIWISYTRLASVDTRMVRFDSSLVQVPASDFLIAPEVVSYMSMCDINATDAWLVVAGNVSTNVKTAVVDATSVVSALSLYKEGVNLLGECFIVEDRTYTLCYSEYNNLPSSGYILDFDGNVVCTFARQSIGLAVTPSFGLNDIKVVNSAAVFACSKINSKSDMYGSLSANSFAVNLQAYTIDFNPDDNVNTKKLGNLLYTSGGYLGMYDGKGFCENGFFEFPEIVQALELATGTPSISYASATDQYLYYAVYEWIDNQGNLHQSATAIKTVSKGSAGNVWYKVVVPRLKLSTEYKLESVKISLFRTQMNQTVPQLVATCPNNIAISGAFAAPAANTVAIRGASDDYVEFQDNLSDSYIDDNRILYVAGGVLENFIPPAPKYLEIYKNRLMAVSPDSSVDMIWYSKNFAYGFGLGFNEALTVLVNPVGGAITALKFMDDKILIFKENILYAMAGEGANDLGVNNNFSSPELISTDVGCITQNSLVLMPLGVMFMSNKGIYLCSRQLQIQYIGAGVEDFNSQTIMSGDMLDDKNQIRFLAKSGKTLIYDYYFDNWGTFTNHEGIDATIWRGVYTYMRGDGTIYVEGSSGLDNTTIIKMKIRTAWLKFAGLQGFQRVRRFAFLGGELEDKHILKITLRYDYQQIDSDTIIFDANQIFSTLYGEGYYGEMEVYGGAEDGVYQFRGHMPRQKCESVQFTFEDISGVEAKGSYSISDLSLEVGLKQGLNKMKLTRTVG